MALKTMRIASVICVLMTLLDYHCTSVYAQTLKQASGIVYRNDTLYIVGNGNLNNQLIFKYPLKFSLSEVGPFNFKPKIDTIQIKSNEATDLEGIAFFDGRLVVLSEDNAKIFFTDSVLLDYSIFSQAEEYKDTIGLEGLSIHQINDSTSKVAVLWEGGFKDSTHTPFIWVHEVSHHQTQRSVDSLFNKKVEIFLNQNTLFNSLKWEGLKDTIAFRAPELVSFNSGFIVLLSIGWNRYHDKKWLCKIDYVNNEYILSDYLDLTSKLEDNIDLNWEGMTWVDDRKLLLVADEGGKPPMHIIEIPDDW